MRKSLPAVLLGSSLTLTILLTGCSNSNTTSNSTNGSQSTPTPYSTEKITPQKEASSLGESNVELPKENFKEDGSFTAPTVAIEKATPPPTASVEEQKTFTDFKTIVTNSLNKMLETGAIQNSTLKTSQAKYVIVKPSATTYKAAVRFNDGAPTPDLLQTINMFIPVVAETSLNTGAKYILDGNTVTINTKLGLYTFGITDGLLTSLTVTGNEFVTDPNYHATISYTTDADAQQIADTAVLPPY